MGTPLFHRLKGPLTACVVALGTTAAAADESGDRRVVQCLEAGYAPGSGMFAACLQESQPDTLGGLNLLDRNQADPESAQDRTGPNGVPEKLLDEDYSKLLRSSPSNPEPAWDWTQ